MKEQRGARFIHTDRIKNQDKEPVCTSHYTPEISIPVRDGVRKRPKWLRRKAD